MTEKDLRIIARMMAEQRMADVQDEDDLPIVLVDYEEDDEEWMKEVAEEKGFSTEDLPYDKIWEAFASELEEAVKEWKEDNGFVEED